MGRQGGIAFGNLLLIDLIEIELLLQDEQQLLAPVAFQAAGNFLPTCLNPSIGQIGQLISVSLSIQNRLNDSQYPSGR